MNNSDAAVLRKRAEEKAAESPKETEPLSPAATRLTLHELRVHQIELEMQNEELRRAQAELDASRALYFDLYDLAPVGYVTVSETGLILEANLTFATLLGVARATLVRQPFSRFITKEDEGVYYLLHKQILATGEPQSCELRMVKKDGEIIWAHLAVVAAQEPGGAPVCRIALSDVTARKLQEDERGLTARLILMVNEPGDFRRSMSELTAALQGWSGCEAVGLRLHAGDDYPYYETSGFAPEFVHLENHLCAVDRNGDVLRDVEGSPVLECMCGNVLSGRFDPSKPFFTKRGSFWSNNTSALLAGTTEADRGTHTRNRCNGEGYESVALIPLRAGATVFGLLQFNDHRPDRFTPEGIAHFERMADSLALALSRRKAKEALQQANATLQAAMDQSPAGIAIADAPGGKLRYVNDAGLLIRGGTRESVVNGVGIDRYVASWQLTDLDGRPLRSDEVPLARAILFGETCSREFVIRKTAGDDRVVLGNAAPIKDEGGTVVAGIVVFTDITERKRLEDVQTFLAQTSSGGTKEPFFGALARYLAQSLGMDFVCIDRLEGDGLNARTVAVWCDGRFEDNVTYALKDTPCGDVVGKQVCCFPASVCQYFPRDQVLKDLRAESYIGVTLFGHSGKPVGLIAVIGRGPLANRPLAEAVLKMVAVRASGEIERQDAEAELHKIDKLQSVGMLAGGIAHDFNNILLGLFGNISIAMEDLAKDHPSYAPLADAEKSMTRAVRLTKQLLTFAKGGDPVKEHVSLGAMAEEVARFDLTGSNVSLVCHHDADLWPVDADRGQIQQVVSNLVINARQAMPSGGHLHVTLENADLPAEAIPGLRAGRYVKVIVRDEGGGIEPKVIEQIFDPYFSTKQTGSGLGLATVWSIINKHGGHISVESEVSKGATFTFYLPASSSRLSAAEESPSAEIPSPASPAKILVMDDEKMVCMLATRMLEFSGYTVVTAADGQEAIALYKQALEAGAPFDAVIMDLTIPGGPGGKEVIQDLLALDPRVRAIVSSGYAEDPIMANPAAYGFKGTLAKPYTAKALREAVARVLA